MLSLLDPWGSIGVPVQSRGAPGLHVRDGSEAYLDALSFLRISIVKQQNNNLIAPPVSFESVCFWPEIRGPQCSDAQNIVAFYELEVLHRVRRLPDKHYGWHICLWH